MNNPEQILNSVFGFPGFRKGQKEVIDQLLVGNSALAVFPTGSGKSLCYQLTGQLLSGLTLVVSPLIALMKDQVDFLQNKNIAAAKIDSTLSLEELSQIWRDIQARKLKLLYIAPERLANEKFVQKLSQHPISMLVIDEAHCMSEWGHNFRPEYLKLVEHAQALKVERVLALTATATPKVAQDICTSFDIKPQAYINTGYYRPNLTLRMNRCKNSEKFPKLLKRINENPPGSTIIYVTLQKEAEDLATQLTNSGKKALFYHAGIKGDLRHEIQEKFMSEENSIVVATIAFGMGIDKSNIRYVYHFNTPKSMENYAQEIGRAGRDGLQSTCEVFSSAEDTTVLANFTYGDTPSEKNVTDLLTTIFNPKADCSLSTYQLSSQHDIRPLVIGTLLCYLELEGLIKLTGHFYNQVKFQPSTDSASILAKFPPDKSDFLRSIFKHAKKGRLWLSLDILETAQSIQQDKLRISKALNYLESENYIKTKVSDVRTSYRLLKDNIDIPSLTQLIFNRFVESEKRDTLRLNELIQLTKSQDCLTQAMLGYFGETLEKPCGHCDRCLGDFDISLSSDTEIELTNEDKSLINEIKNSDNPYFETRRNIAKFLCGITSPKMSRGRPALNRDKNFGALTKRPFHKVLQFVNE
ncbi:MAG: RecQ family ATP-dependent DNA helicase [Lentisphaeraceae bacterium]|nr:RecQ family ATP-dependent DNA helicase [Lentisphaeraceae bacterium]